MYLAHKHCYNYNDKSSSNIDDTNTYTGSGGSSVIGKEYPCPSPQNETPHHSMFLPPSINFMYTSTKESSSNVNSLLNNVNCTINVGQHSLSIGNNSTFTNVSNEMSTVEVNYKFQQKERRIDADFRLGRNHEISKGIGQIRAAKKHSPHLSHCKNVINPDDENSYPTNRCSQIMDTPSCNELDQSIMLVSDKNGSCTLCQEKNDITTEMEQADCGHAEIMSNCSCNINQCDNAEWGLWSSTADLQNCRSKSVDVTVQTLGDSKERSVFPVSSTRSRRQRQIEVERVHQVYSQIAPHCDNVRQKAWPRVKRFLKELEPGSMVVDVGCGNGRYLKINSSIFKIGCDLCPPFLEQARVQGHEVMTADNIALPYRDATFDAVISIGVIHHFASLERRIRAISELSRVLSPGGKLMVYVWAFEQIHRKFESQDVLIPWVKPEVKDQARRNTIGCLGESDSYSVDSPTGSTPLDDTTTRTLRRRQRNEPFNNNSSGHRCRSKSLNDEESAMYGRRAHYQRDRFGSPKFGVFDRRDGGQGELEGTKDNPASERDNAVFDDVTECEGQCNNYNTSSYEDFRAKSKWRGQLVSECRKLGKYFRSLSSRSDSQSNGEADFWENVEEAAPDLHLERNEHPDAEVSLTMTQKGLSNECSSAVLGPTITALQTDQNGGATQDVCCPLSGVNITTIRGGSSSVNSDHNINLTLSSGLGEIYDKNNIPSSAATTTYHDAQTKRSHFTHTTPITKDSSDSTVHTTGSFARNFNCNSRHRNNTEHDTVVETVHTSISSACRQLATSASTSNSSCTSQEPTSESENQMCKPRCLGYLPGCSDHSNLQPISGNSVTLTISESFISGELSSCLSDKTVTDIQLDFKSDMLPLKYNCLNEAPLKQNKSYSCGDAVKNRNVTIFQSSSIDSTSHDDTDQRTSPQTLSIDGLPYQHFFHPSNKHNRDHLLGETRHPLSSRSNTSTEVNYPSSDLGDSTDYLDSESIFSLNQDTSQCLSTNIPCQEDKTDSETHPMEQDNSNVSFSESADSWAQIAVNNESVHLDLKDFTKHHIDKTPGTKSPKSKNQGDVRFKDTAPLRATFKTILHKFKDYFHLQSRNQSKTFGCYHSGKSLAKKFVTEIDSSENETPVSSISTHSSCYPGIFSVSQNKAIHEKNDIIPGMDNCAAEGYAKDDVFEMINNTKTPAANHILDTGNAEYKLKPLRIDIIENKQNVRQDFVHDVSEVADHSGKDTPTHSPTEPYMFDVEHLSLAAVKKESFFHSIAKKWSGMFSKDEATAQVHACMPVASTSLSSSDDNDETLTISLVENDNADMCGNQPSNKAVVRRPTSLDFNKKRTRRKGRRPAPKTDNITNGAETNRTEYKLQNINTIIQSKKMLTLSDAMTLLGDGASEESIIERLDDSARTIFLQMKRMNFAIRKFPMSSLDSDGNDEASKDIPESLAASGRESSIEEAAQTKPTTLKMRREKLIFSSRRRLSDSIASQDTPLRRKRKTVKRQTEIMEADSMTKANHLQRQCLSEDLVSFFNSFGIQRCKHDSQYLFSSSLDVKPDLFTPLQLSAESQQISANVQKRMYYLATSSDNSKLISSCKHGNPFVESVDSLDNGVEINKELMKYESLNEYDGLESDELVKNDDEYEYHSLTCGIRRLHGSYQLCDYSKSTEGVTNESAVGLNTNQSNWEDKFLSANSNASSLITSNQSTSNNPPSQSTTCDSANQNLESRTFSFNQSKSSGRHPDNSLCRYYHVFKKGELDQLVTKHVPSLRIVDTFYDHANWCIIAEKI